METRTEPGDLFREIAELVQGLINLARLHSVRADPDRTRRYAEIAAWDEIFDRITRQLKGHKAVQFYRARQIEIEFGLPPVADPLTESGEIFRLPQLADAAMRAVSSASAAAVTALKRLRQTLAERSGTLPVAERSRAYRVETSIGPIMSLLEELRSQKGGVARRLSEAAVAASAKAARTLSRKQRVLAKWYLDTPEYRGKWRDMQALAHAWNLSKIQDAANFRRYVNAAVRKSGKPGRLVYAELDSGKTISPGSFSALFPKEGAGDRSHRRKDQK